MKKVVEPLCVSKKARKPLQATLFTETCRITKHGFWRFLFESEQRDEAISASFSVLDQMVLNDGLVNHAQRDPETRALTVGVLLHRGLAATLAICLRVDLLYRITRQRPRASNRYSIGCHKASKPIDRWIGS